MNGKSLRRKYEFRILVLYFRIRCWINVGHYFMLSKITFAELLEKVDSAPPLGSKIRVTDRGNQVFIYTENGYVPEITWTNCADEMPPDDYVICRSYVTNGTIKYHKTRGELFNLNPGNWQWTEFTPKKWEELNK